MKRYAASMPPHRRTASATDGHPDRHSNKIVPVKPTGQTGKYASHPAERTATKDTTTDIGTNSGFSNIARDESEARPHNTPSESAMDILANRKSMLTNRKRNVRHFPSCMKTVR